jgi:hypothetical protein
MVGFVSKFRTFVGPLSTFVSKVGQNWFIKSTTPGNLHPMWIHFQVTICITCPEASFLKQSGRLQKFSSLGNVGISTVGAYKGALHWFSRITPLGEKSDHIIK